MVITLYIYMSFQKLAELADEFIIKIAEHKYENEAPPDVRADDLDWLDEQTRAEIKFNGTSPEYQPFDKTHNPPGIIGSEKTWDRAKKAVKKYWKKYKEPWAVTMYVYQRMGGKSKKKSKKKK